MCTAITFSAKNHYFGRNLDFEYDFGESIVVTPRNYPLQYRYKDTQTRHFAMIGIALVESDYPLYFDATNECGLSMAGLYFPGNATYLSHKENMDNITPFEFIPWILSQCKNLAETRLLLNNINLVDTAFSQQYPLTPLHWIIADKNAAITVEPMASGVKVYDNPIGVLTNNPPFDFHMLNLSNYMNLTSQEPENRFSPKHVIKPYSRGMGAIGLPGDLSSSSRFVRAAFIKSNSVCENTEACGLSQFFHILHAVEQQSGCVQVGERFEKTIYTSCCDTDNCVYYYTTYENTQITAIRMHNTDINTQMLIEFPLNNTQQIQFGN